MKDIFNAVMVSLIITSAIIAGPSFFSDDTDPATPPTRNEPRLTFAESGTHASQPTDVKVYVSESCLPCHAMQSDVGDGDDETRVTYVNQAIPRAIDQVERSQGREAAYPCTTWRDESGTLRYLIGRSTLSSLKQAIERNNPKREAVTSSRAGESRAGQVRGLNLGAVITQARASGVKSARVKWSRDEAKSLKMGEQWSQADLLGRSGTIVLDATGQTWSVKELAVNYGKTDATVTGDPASILIGAISLARLLLPLLKPTVSLDIPKTNESVMTFDGETIHVSFVTGPRVSINSLLTYRRRLTGVSISGKKIVAEFDENRFWKRIVIASGGE